MWKRRSIETLVRKVDEMEQVFSKRDRGRPRKFGGRLLGMILDIRAL